MIYEIEVDGFSHRVELLWEERELRCKLNGEILQADICLVPPDVISLLMDGRPYEIRLDRRPSQSAVLVSSSNLSARFDCSIRDPRALRGRRGASMDSEGPRKINAPMPGRVVRILAPPGTEVEQGQGVIVIEAMKMQNELKSPKKGKVSSILAAQGATVNPGDPLVIIE